jgi:hypothetical protein
MDLFMIGHHIVSPAHVEGGPAPAPAGPRHHSGRFLRVILPVLLLLLIQGGARGQQFGGNPPSTRWQRIDTDTVRVIFPVGLGRQAERVANTVHHLSRYNRRSIGEAHAKVSIVLQDQTTRSNGYVGLVPFRSEFYTTPPQSPYFVGSNWLDLLTIHEYRHVLQFVNTRVGLTRLFYILGGELGWSTLNAITIPDWFWEGDAVVYETALSAEGRGRMPEFYNGFRALELSGLRFNYQKVRNGSLRHFVPDHYQSGYLLCRYGREQYGNDFWKPVLRDAARIRSVLYPFAGAVKRYSGLRIRDFYARAMDDYQQRWETTARDETAVQFVTDPARPDNFTSYRYPQYAGDSTLIAYKVSYRNIGGFYAIRRDGRERRLIHQGLAFDSYFSYRDSTLVWSETAFHERWGWRDYANIVAFDLKSGKKQKITRKSRYFSPDISRDGSRIVAFHATTDLRYALHILNREDGSLRMALPNPDNLYFSYPKWCPDDGHLVALVRNAAGQNGMARIDTRSGKMSMLVPYTHRQIGIPHPTEEYVYFSASYSGVDQIYAVRLSDQRMFRVTTRSMGGYEPSVNPSGHELAFSEYSAQGHRLAVLPARPANWMEVFEDAGPPPALPDPPYAGEEGGNILNSIPERSWEPSAHRQISGLINPHSWGLYFNDPEYQLSIQSDNVLNTLSMGAGARYNRNLENTTWFFNAVYGQIYPLLRFEANLRPRSQVFTGNVVDENGEVVDQVTLKQNWWEAEMLPGVVLPFNLSSGTYQRALSLFTGYMYTLQFDRNLRKLEGPDVDLSGVDLSNNGRHSIETGMNFINRRLKARQNIFPSYSQFLFFRYRQSVDGDANRQIFADSEWTFPGLFRNHNTVVQASWQQENRDAAFSYVDNFFYPRGYDRPYYIDQSGRIIFYDHIYKTGINYHFPLLYPDLGLAGILYIYRLRFNAFFDHARAFYGQLSQDYNSAGAELALDTRFMNAYDLSFGLRYSYLLNVNPLDPDRTALWEFFIPLLRF